MPSKDPFAVLGLTPTASPDEVRAAYRAAARRLHPDVGGDAEAFKELRRAVDEALEFASGARPNPYLPTGENTLRVDPFDRHAHSPPPPPNVWRSDVVGGALFWILPVAAAILMLSVATGRYFLPIYLASMGVFAIVVSVVLRRRG